MPNFSFVPLEGTIQNIRPFGDECCSSLVTLQTSEGTVTVVVSSDTYVISEVRLRRGMTVAAFYDAQVPVPLIYPPQYRAVILGRKQPNETITVDYFDETLTNDDNTLKLNVSPATDIVGSNGQPFRCSLVDRLLIVYYFFETVEDVSCLGGNVSSRGRLLLCADFLAQNPVLIRYGTKHNAKGGSYFCRPQLLFSYFYYPLSKQKKHIHSQESLSMHSCCLYDIAQCLRCISLLLQLHSVPSCEIRYS